MTILTSAWALSNYLTNQQFGDSVALNDLFNRVAYMAAFLAILAGTLFTYYFPVGRRVPKGEWWLLGISAGLLTGLSATRFGAGTVALSPDGLVFSAGSLITIYALVLLAYVSLIAYNLWLAVRKEHGAVKEQALLILFGFGFTVLFGIVSNILVPALINNAWPTQIGPVLTLVLVGCITYAIVKHRLFDIRGVVARSVGYVLSIAVFVALYGFIVFGIADTVFNLEISIRAQVFLSAATGFAALVFPKVRAWFDKLTSRLFYQDRYDPQQLYADLNKVLVSSLDIKYLMMRSIAVIESAIQPEYALVGLRDEKKGQRIFSPKERQFAQEDIDTLRSLTPHIKHKVTITDNLVNQRQAELRALLQKNDIAALVRLASNVRSGEDGFGYLLLGVKKSGNPYTLQDAQVLDTVGGELIIAIQNALHYEEIQQFNLVLQAKVDEATRKLRGTNEKLKALDETKDDFISMASHQLRTPLTSVKGYLSMVLEGDAGDINETQRKMLSQAYTSSQRMVYLIADLLNVSRLKTGKFIIESAPTDLSHMIEEELGQLTEAAAARSLTLTYDKPKDFPVVMLDETKTRQVLMNFIDNAIYYTPKDGHIRIELKDTGPTIEFRVVDDGIGVPKAEQHHLFTKFYRAGNARKARPDGTGLGLFMAKKVITAQNGALIFDSKEGVGSTFGFTFAKAKLAANPVEAEQVS